jgi:hypothetical protein
MTATVADARLSVPSARRWWSSAGFAWSWPLGVFLLTRLAAWLFISVASGSQIALGFDTIAGYHVYHELPADPGYLGVITNWDGQWYQALATEGYRRPSPAETPDQRYDTVWAWAFPPGFPMLVRVLMLVTGLSFAVSATVVNLVAGALALVVWFKVFERAGGRALATAGTLLACCFVTAPLFQAAYSESLAMLFLGLALLAVQRHQYLLAIAPVTALGLTRLITPVVAVVVLAQVVDRVRRGGRPVLRERQTVHAGVLCAIALTMTFLWSAVASAILGHNQGFERTAKIAGEWRFGWFASAYEAIGLVGLALVLMIAVLFVLVGLSPFSATWGLELRVWSLAYPLFLLTFTPMTSGILRYLLLAPTLGLVVAGSPGDRGLSRGRWALVGLVAAAGLVCQYLWVDASLAVTSTTPLMP